MPLDTKARIALLNKVTHTVRPSSFIFSFGPGSMTNFPDQTLMAAAPEFWETQTRKIHDARLERALGVDYFGTPAEENDPEKGKHFGVSYVRFPEWYFCPKCREFKPLSQWVADYRRKASQKIIDSDSDMVKHVRCFTCHADLVVARIVTVCENGHIDDFPWVKWTHARSTLHKMCDNPRLKLKTSSSASEGLDGIKVECVTCGATATLAGAFNKDSFEVLENKTAGRFGFGCTGNHPWKHQHEKCACFPRALQRGSSSVYFPTTVASLVIPPYSSMLTLKIEESPYFEECRSKVETIKNTMAALPKEIRSQYMAVALSQTFTEEADKIAIEIGVDSETVKTFLSHRWEGDGEEESITETDYKAEEYDVLTGVLKSSETKYDGDFVLERMQIAAYHLPYIKRINLIHKIREIIALTGFSRVAPVEYHLGDKTPKGFVSIKEKNTDWYPAYQVRGEGIFVEFDNDQIEQWRKSIPDIDDRAKLLQRNYDNSYFAQSREKHITTKYVLLHTISHLLIKQLSFECGYGIASLKERIYCNETDDGKQMSGIFIYTAGGDSEGTLGGLVRQGRPDTFPRIFKKAIETARICSNDPVCSLSNGQGRDSLNLAACYSCSLIPETSCEAGNCFLDRGLVIGTMRLRNIGLYSNLSVPVIVPKPEQTPEPESRPIPESKPVVPNPSNVLVIKKKSGMNTESMPWSKIWHDEIPYGSDASEREVIKGIEGMANLFAGKEHPIRDCEFTVNGIGKEFNGELMWLNSKVALFSGDNTDGYEACLSTDWKAFILSDSSFTAMTLIENLNKQ